MSSLASSRMSKVQVWIGMQSWCFQTRWGWWSVQYNRSEVVDKGSTALLKESIQLCGVSQDYYPRKSFLREPGKLEKNTPSNSPKAPGTNFKFGKAMTPSRGITRKCAPHERILCAPKFEERSHEETSRREGCARRTALDLAKIIYKLKNSDKASFFLRSKCNAGTDEQKKKNRAQVNWILSQSPEHPLWYWLQTECAHQRGSTSVRSRLKSVRDSPITGRNVYSSITWKTLRRPRIISSLLSFQGSLHRHHWTRQEEKWKYLPETVGDPLQFHLGGIISHNGMMHYPKFQILELCSGNFLNLRISKAESQL